MDYEFPYRDRAIGTEDAGVTVWEESGNGVFYWKPAWIPVQYIINLQLYLPKIKQSGKYGMAGHQAYAVLMMPRMQENIYGGLPGINQAMFDFEGNPFDP